MVAPVTQRSSVVLIIVTTELQAQKKAINTTARLRWGKFEGKTRRTVVLIALSSNLF